MSPELSHAEHHVTLSATKGISQVRWVLEVLALEKTKTKSRGRWFSGSAHAREKDATSPIAVPVLNHLCTA